MKALKVTAFSSLGFSLAFSLVSLVFYFGDWNRFVVVSLMGFFVGVVAAPEIEPKLFSNPWMLQAGAGLAFGLVVGLGFGLAPEEIVATSVIGGFAGWSAPFWVKHAPIP